CNMFQTRAAIEHSVSNGSDPVGNYDVGQARTAIERISPDFGDAGGNREAGKPGAAVEGPVPYGDDRQSFDRARDDHGTVGTSVTGDNDGAVLFFVTGLGFHDGGQYR